MPELFIPANGRPTATQDTRARQQSDAQEQTLGARDGDFSRTLQTQLEERRAGERRNSSASASASQPGGASDRTSQTAPRQPTRARQEQASEPREPEAPAASAKPAQDTGKSEHAADTSDDEEAVQDPAVAAAAAMPLAAQLAAAGQTTGPTPPSQEASATSATGESTATEPLPEAMSADTPDEQSPDGSSGRRPASPLHAQAESLTAGTDKAGAAKPGAPADTAGATELRAQAAPIREMAVHKPDGVAAAAPQENGLSATGQGLATTGDAGGQPPQSLASAHLAVGAGRAQTTPAAPTPTSFIATPADHSGFADEVGQRVVLFAGRGESKAELILTPAHLGRIEVSLTVSAEQATAQFLASSNAARDALEQALPRLREMLAEAGIHLGESHVGTQSEQQSGDGRQASRYQGSEFGPGADTMSEGSRRWIRQGSGMIDTFA
ncbi:MAG: flagellar hook-length control protein FliK [Rhodocyclaceae bacterium]|nr:flagellar hook-length control protein FliK [Rhodocyclaceae bacterium]